MFCLSYLDLIKILEKITNLEEYNYAKGKGKLSTDANLRYACYFILSIFKMVLFHLKYNIIVVYGPILITDIMKMRRKADVLRDYCEHIEDFLICYVLNNKIISVQIFQASALLYCHLFDCNEMIDNKPPFLSIVKIVMR